MNKINHSNSCDPNPSYSSNCYEIQISFRNSEMFPKIWNIFLKPIFFLSIITIMLVEGKLQGCEMSRCVGQSWPGFVRHWFSQTFSSKSFSFSWIWRFQLWLDNSLTVNQMGSHVDEKDPREIFCLDRFCKKSWRIFSLLFQSLIFLDQYRKYKSIQVENVLSLVWRRTECIVCKRKVEQTSPLFSPSVDIWICFC